MRWRRAQIVEAAARLMEQHGFHAMSVNALAREAGISVGTVYQYVQRKEDVLLLVFRDIFEAYGEAMPAAMADIEDPIERLAAGMRAYCSVVDRRRAATLLAYRESQTLDEADLKRVMGLELETTGLLAACLSEAIAAGVVIEGVDVDVASYDLVMLAHMWALKHWHFGARLTLEQYADEQLRILLRGMVVPAQQQRYRHLLGPGGAPVSGPRRPAAASRRTTP